MTSNYTKEQKARRHVREDLKDQHRKMLSNLQDDDALAATDLELLATSSERRLWTSSDHEESILNYQQSAVDNYKEKTFTLWDGNAAQEELDLYREHVQDLLQELARSLVEDLGPFEVRPVRPQLKVRKHKNIAGTTTFYAPTPEQMEANALAV